MQPHPPSSLNRTKSRCSTTWRTTVLAALAVCALATAPAARADPPGNRIVDPGAEDPALSAWQAAGTASVPYGSPNVPVDPGLAGAGGSRLFAFQTPSASLTQTVDLSDLAPSIDATGVRVSVGGTFGASGARTDTAQLTTQPLDAGGTAIGTSRTVGPATPEDRGNATVGTPCNQQLEVPPGTRAVRVDVTSTGGADGANTAFADNLYVTTAEVAFTATGVITAAGCYRDITSFPSLPAPVPVPPTAPSPPPKTPLPKLAALVSMSTKTKCRKTPARFRVKPSQRTAVKRLSVTARGRTVTRDPRRSSRYLTIAVKTRRTTMKLKVDLLDGRSRTGTVTYRACR
jgi:hypothetical protein